MTRKLIKREQFKRLGEFILTGKTTQPAPLTQQIKPIVKSNQRETGKSGVTDDCLKYLKSLELSYPITSRRLNNGAGILGTGGFYQYGIKGGYDILVTLSGRLIWVETKSGRGGRLSEDQIHFKQQQTRAGAICFEVCSRDELKLKFEPLLKPFREKAWSDFLKAEIQ